MHSFRCGLILGIVLKELVLAGCQKKHRIFSRIYYSSDVCICICLHIHLSDLSIHGRIFVIMSCMHFEHFIIFMHVLPFFSLHKMMCFFVHTLRTSFAYTSGNCFFKGSEFFVHALLLALHASLAVIFSKGRPFFYPVESTRPCSSPPLSLVFSRQRKT